MIICQSSDATGPRNLNQSSRQDIVGLKSKKGVSDLHDLRLRGPGMPTVALAHTRKGKDKPLMA